MQDEINILQTNINTNCNSRDGNDCDDLIAEVQRLRDENSSLLKIIEELTTQQNASNSKQLNTTNPPAQQNQHHLQHSTISNHKVPTKTAIIGDSMIKHLQSKKMSRTRDVKCFTHRGVRIEQLTQSALTITQKENPSNVVIHAGTNNNNDTVELVINKAQHLASTLQRSGVPNIAFSGLIPRTNGDTLWTYRVNEGISRMCSGNGWHFIDNNNIEPRHICQDGVHLNRHGTIQLAKNLISYIRQGRPSTIRMGTSFADAVRTQPPQPLGFQGRRPAWNPR
ncbi:hypothetical protein Bbelb_080170 [Branchiostoma belcheri]|nr:hypothetical protein Bbelb_080170 [Branchiostoma belcheri]